jgi:ElaB/YqjD/DUF883 family membrane-anchored ribosome-binding protein
MGETIEQIEAHIRQTRDDLVANLNELERKLKSAVDWRKHYQNHPFRFLAAAAAAGLLLSLISGRPRAPASRRSDTTQFR